MSAPNVKFKLTTGSGLFLAVLALLPLTFLLHQWQLNAYAAGEDTPWLNLFVPVFLAALTSAAALLICRGLVRFATPLALAASYAFYTWYIPRAGAVILDSGRYTTKEEVMSFGAVSSLFWTFGSMALVVGIMLTFRYLGLGLSMRRPRDAREAAQAAPGSN